MRLDGVHNELRPVVVRAGDARDEHFENVMHIQQDVKIFSGQIDADETFSYRTEPTHGAWVQVAKGTLELNGQRLEQGDGCEIHDEAELLFTGAVRFAVERGTDEELAQARKLLRTMWDGETDEETYLNTLGELTQLIHAASRNLVLQLVRNGIRSLFERRSF